MVFLGQNSSAGKLKTLSGALDIMTKTKGAFQLIRNELVAETEQVKELQGVWYGLPSGLCLHKRMVTWQLKYSLVTFP